MAQKVTVREVGLRDGLQNLAQMMSTAQKTAWLSAEAAAGVSEFEVTSLVSPKLLPQFSDAAEVIAHGLKLPAVRISALTPNLKGAERGFVLGVHQVNFVLSVSEGHNRSNVRRSTQESLDDFGRICALRRSGGFATRVAGGLATSFGCTIDGAVDEGRVLALAHQLAEAGADELIVADTVGYGNPAAVKRVFTPLCRDLKIPITAHFHNTRGLGLANVVAALDAGVRRFDAALGGLGGCPYAPGATGNIDSEDCVFMLEEMGFETGTDLPALLDVRRQIESELPGVEFHGDLARAGLPKTFVAPTRSGQVAGEARP